MSCSSKQSQTGLYKNLLMHIPKNDAREGVRGAVISREPVLQHNIIRDFSCFFCNL